MPQIDLDFDLTGCEATWQPATGATTWTGWLPHIDLDVSQQFTKGSAPHAALWTALEEPGELMLRGQLDLTDMLRPAVQPGSKIDYEYPPESPTVTFTTDIAQRHTATSAARPRNGLPRTKRSRVSFTLPADRAEDGPLRTATEEGKRARITRRGMDDERGQSPATAAASPTVCCRGPIRAIRRQNTIVAGAAARTRRRQLGPRLSRVLRRESRLLEVPQRSTAVAATSAPTCQISSIAITPRSCATSRILASRSTRIIFPTS